MKPHPPIPDPPDPSRVPNAGLAYASNLPRQRNLTRLAGFPVVLLLCLGCFLRPFDAGAAPMPMVTLDTPTDVLIGDCFTFKVKFKNLSPTPGYGPFIDLVLDAGDADFGSAGGPCDGITFMSATLLTGGPLPLTSIQNLAPCPAVIPPPGLCVPLFTHPFGSGLPLSVIDARPGSELQTIILPFSHYESTQPELEIEVTACVSAFADANVPLSICARGGFRYGDDPLDNPITDPPILSDYNLNSCGWTECRNVNPTVMTLSKAYLGPEKELATGTNFVSLYPLTYQVTVDVALGQTINNLLIQDSLPPTLVYQNNVVVKINGVTVPGGTCGTTGVQYEILPTIPPTTVPPAPLSGSVLNIQLCNPITGTAASNEVVVTFDFFIPEFDAFGNPILGSGCAALITNLVQASGSWTPNDPRDLPTQNIAAGPVTNFITAKCLAVQKSVTLFQDLNYPGPTPGDLLRYEISFQISDYKTLGQLVLTDCLSDGQYLEWLPLAPWPQLTVTDQFGTMQADFDGFFFGTAWTQDLDTNCLCQPLGLSANQFTFNISQLMTLQFPPPFDPRHAAGILTGGLASAPASTTPATGTLVFYARIYDQYFYPTNLPGDGYVDKLDLLLNCADLEGELYQNLNAPAVPLPIGPFTSDDGKAAVILTDGPFVKTNYAVNGQLTWPGFPNPPLLGPGDTVTFRLTKFIPSGDAENVILSEFPPLPVLKVDDPNATGFPGYIWPAAPLPSSAVPPPSGQSQYGPAHTLPNTFPAVVSSSLPNELQFNFGTFFNPANTPYVIDLLFTMTVTSDPFADGLILNNEAVECEDNTLGVTFCDVKLAKIKIVEPNLKILKGIVASDNPKTVFTKPGLSPLTFTPPGSAACPRFAGGVINSTTLPNLPGLDSDVTCADNGDTLTFAIVVQNVGSASLGAYDILIQDMLPSCLGMPFNICVTDGAGTVLPWIGNLFGPGLELVDPNPPGALAPAHPTSGKDIAIITFDATYVPGPQPQCCTNDVALVNYSNVESGSNFVTANFGGPFTDTAEVCSLPKPVLKCIVATSEGHTPLPEVAIGEIVLYQLQVQIPEGTTSPNFNVQDFLPLGLAYMPGSAKVAFVANGNVLNSLGAPTVPGDETLPELLFCRTLPLLTNFPAGQITAPLSGGPVVFNTLGFFNPDNDPNCEFLVIEFNALVLNVPGNQACIVLPNQFGVFDGPTPIGPLSPPVSVTVFEPNITGVAKQVIAKPQKIGDPVTYSVSFMNAPGPCATTAFDVRVQDTMPGCLGNLTFVSASPPPTLNLSTASILDITWAMVPVGQSVVVTYTALQLCGDCSKLTNTANVTWTSLPGPNGTFNPIIGQSTPGASGAVNGERNGVTPSLALNDYFASSSANLCPDLAITKTTMGAFLAGLNGTYMITVTNNGCGPAVAPVTVTDTIPPGLTPVSAAGNNWLCTISGNTVTCIYTGPSIPPGGTFPPITITVAISSAAGNSAILNCAQVNSPNDNNPANNQSCVGVTVLTNQCLTISNEVITCSTNGGYTFSFDLVNLSAFPAYTVSFVAATPFGVTVTPSPFVLSPPLNPGDPPRPVSVNINGPGCAKVCFLISIHDRFDVNCCTPDSAIPKCIVLPECDCVPAPTNMVGWWRGDNSTTDFSGTGNNGAWVGTAGYVFGEVGQAFSVANPSDYVSVPTAASLNFNASQSFTIDAWVRTLNPGIAPIVDKRSGTIFAASGYSFYLFNGTLGLQLNGVNYISPNPAINDGEWHHVAAVVDRLGGQARLYVNGTQVHSVGISSVGSVANTGDFRIGQDRFGNNSFQGQLDEVELFRRALTDPEIKSLWQAGCAGKCKCVAPPSGLVNWWRFDVKVGSSVFDTVGFLNTGTTPAALQSGIVSNALFLNGVNQWVTVPNQADVNFTGTCTGPGGAQSFTIDTWIKTDQLNGTLLDKRTPGPFGLNPRGYRLTLVNGQPSFTLAAGLGSTYTFTASSAPFLADNQWHFVAITYDRCANVLKVYVDSNFTPVQMFNTVPLGSIANTSALYIGRLNPNFGSAFYRGYIDELEYFKRVLSDLEIYSIWNASSAGKCRPGQPSIAQGPSNQSAQAGSTAAFNVVAFNESGESLSYQWLFNGAPLAAGTNETLTVSDAQPANVGAYSVVVSDSSGSVTSAPATLTVVGSGNYVLWILPGDNLIANQLNNINNLLNTVIPSVPDGTTLYKFDSGGFSVFTYLSGFGWDDAIGTFDPGEGAFLRNNSGAPFALTFTGTPVTPLPVPLDTGPNFVSRRDLGPGTFEAIVGQPPVEGTVVYRFNTSAGGDATNFDSDGYTSCSFVDGAWDCDPTALPGESVWILMPEAPDAPPTIVTASASCASNTVTVVFSEEVTQVSAGDSFNYGLDGGVTIGGATLRADGETVDLNTSPLQAGTTYTLTVNEVMDLAGNPIAANSQITVGCPTNALPAQTLVASVTGGKLMFEWEGIAVLQEADKVTGPWTDVAGASSGYMANMSGAQKFYRLRYP